MAQGNLSRTAPGQPEAHVRLLDPEIKLLFPTRKNKTIDSEDAGNQFDNLVTNAPRILDEVNREISAQREQGVTDDQMKGLLQKKQLLELGTSIPPEVYNIIGKPLVKKIIGLVGKI